MERATNRPKTRAAPIRDPPAARVLMVTDSLDPGGAERHVVDLATALARRGHDVTIACSTGGALQRDAEIGGVHVKPLMHTLVKRRFSATFARRLGTLVTSGEFDLVHAHVYASATAAAEAVAGVAVPLVITEHTEAPWRGLPERAISRTAYARADHILAVSTAIRTQLLREFDVPARKASYVPSAIVALSEPQLARPLPSGCDRARLVGRVARLQPEKGIEVFLRAAAALAPRAPDVRFLIVGAGPVRDRLETLCRRLAITDRVYFLGHRADARAIIATLDLLVVSSLNDGSPLVVLEAMASATPIVASRTGGIPDQLRDGVDGLLVRPGSARALATAMERSLGDPDAARLLAASGRRRVRSRFRFDAMLADVERAYGIALERRAPAAGVPEPAATPRASGALAG
jgi:glycosyltransferase involved in cell wall biosynthesis